MAISPPTDIVLDVARAADPVKYREAVERLARLSASAAARAETPASLGSAPAQGKPQQPPLAAPTIAAAFRPAGTASPAPAHNKLEPFAQFEAFVLQSFIQAMLPAKADSVYGKGFAGDVWKSMLAEKLGAELARSGQIGIASRLAKDASARPLAAAAPAASATPPTALRNALPYLTPDAEAKAAAPDKPTPSSEQS